jgi:hypothetical protein
MRYCCFRFRGLVMAGCIVALVMGAGLWLASEWPIGGTDLVRSRAFSEPEGEVGLNLPEDYARRVRQRAVMDAYASRFHVVEAEIAPKGMRPQPRYRTDHKAVRIAHSELPESVLEYRHSLEEVNHPLRGFRAPILEDALDLRPATLDEKTLTALQIEAAGLIRTSLAFDGVLLTLAKTIELLGPKTFQADEEEAGIQLRDLGFPVDLVQFFRLESDGSSGGSVIGWIATELSEGRTVEDLKPLLEKASFAFRPTEPGFKVAEETGEHEIGLLRLQIGGGYSDGIIRGGSIDVSGQLVAALPKADILMSVPEDYLENIHWLALHCWPLKRVNHLSLVPEKLPVSAWAQDNGKAGSLTGNRGKLVPATLVPRYASRDEIASMFMAAESFLADGLRAANHPVFQSPLLFQGGNILVAREPANGRRILLLSETELHRNRALGLTEDQVIEAFHVEFAVDQCVVLPAVSYHLDYDITLRMHEGEVVAFVNNTTAAAHVILQRAIAAFEQAGLMPARTAATALQQLARKEYAPVIRSLAPVIAPHISNQGQFRTGFVRLFSSEATDSPVLNMQCFFAAMDVLASSSLSNSEFDADEFTKKYFTALRDLDTTARQQQKILRKLGWKIVAVPSMPDLYRSINYLNGIHDKDRYIMPAVGGFYSALDQAAETAFKNALGGSVAVVRIFTQEIQRHNGGLHCVAAAYPSMAKSEERRALKTPLHSSF